MKRYFTHPQKFTDDAGFLEYDIATDKTYIVTKHWVYRETSNWPLSSLLARVESGAWIEVELDEIYRRSKTW